MAFLVRALPTTIVAAAALAAPAFAGSAAGTPVREHIDLTLVSKTHGATRFVHRGEATGTFKGTVRSKITLAHSVILTGSVTITLTDGSTVRLKVAGRARSIAQRTKFNGTATITGGTHKYAHAQGSGTFSGIVNRSTWHTSLDASGAFTTS